MKIMFNADSRQPQGLFPEVPFEDLTKIGEGRQSEVYVSEKDPAVVIKELDSKRAREEGRAENLTEKLQGVRKDIKDLEGSFGEWLPPTQVVIGKNGQGEERIYLLQDRIEGEIVNDIPYSESVADELRRFFDKTIRFILQSLEASPENPPKARYPDFTGVNFILGRDMKRGDATERLFFVDVYPVKEQEVEALLKNLSILEERFSAQWLPLAKELKSRLEKELEAFIENRRLEKDMGYPQVVGFLRSRLHRAIAETPQVLDGLEAEKEYLLDFVRAKSMGTVPGKEADLDQILGLIRSSSFASTDALIEELGEKVASLFLDSMPISVLEKKMRDNLNKTKNFTEVSRALSFDVVGQELKLHIPPVFLKNGERFPDLLKEGFGILARRITADPGLQDIDIVSGASKIVADHPRFIEGLGFKITGETPKHGWGRAVMTRDDFLRLYL